MARDILITDEEVEREIERLNESPAVLLARQEQRIKYRRRQYLYQLRSFEKRGKQLMEAGITYEDLKQMDVPVDMDGES
jgi:hypothetical protein